MGKQQAQVFGLVGCQGSEQRIEELQLRICGESRIELAGMVTKCSPQSLIERRHSKTHCNVETIIILPPDHSQEHVRSLKRAQIVATYLQDEKYFQWFAVASRGEVAWVE
jgi:hypothetical protein